MVFSKIAERILHSTEYLRGEDVEDLRGAQYVPMGLPFRCIQMDLKLDTVSYSKLEKSYFMDVKNYS